MSTTAEKLQTIIDNKAAIKQAIIDKGGQVGDFTTYAEAIANLPNSGGGGDVNPTAENNDVTFYDYDGTIRYSYTAEEFLALTEMPPLPTQKGLICQEWNWSYEDAMEYVAEYGILDVGATYITDDGKTRLYIRIAAEGRMDVPLYFNQSVANGVVIDWGDGSATQTLSGTGNVNTTHHYNSISEYIITLDVNSGNLSFGSSEVAYCVMGNTNINGRVYCAMLQKVEIGTGVKTINIASFYYCLSLASVTIPNSVTAINKQTFQNCSSLSFVVLPQNINSLGVNLFSSCSTLVSVAIPKLKIHLPYSMFYNCYNLTHIVIPYLIGNNANTLSYCYSLSSIVITKETTNIPGATFSSCTGMAFYDFSHHTAVPTLANTGAFSGIPSDCKIIVPDNLYYTWIAATNWSTYVDYIIKKSDWDARNNQ